VTKRDVVGLCRTEAWHFLQHHAPPSATIGMSTAAPDPRTLQTWEDAFQYPVPIVAKLQQQLRSHADDNREKLRSLVGYDCTCLR
jgi:hypothetical protein